MTGFDRLSYQSALVSRRTGAQVPVLAAADGAQLLPCLRWGGVSKMALIAALTCWLRVSPWRWWCRWMALPFGFLLIGCADHSVRR